MKAPDVHKPGSMFNAQSFGSWLRRWRDAENFQWGTLAAASNLAPGSIHAMASGKGPGRKGHYDPSVSTMYRLSVGLDLDLAYLLEKGGLPAGGQRWGPFSVAERTALMQAIATAGANPLLPDGVQVVLRRLSDEIAGSMPSHEENT